MTEVTVFEISKKSNFLNDPRFNYIDRDESSTFTRKLFLESFHVTIKLKIKISKYIKHDK